MVPSFSLLGTQQGVCNVLKDEHRPKSLSCTLSKPMLREGNEFAVVHSGISCSALDPVDERQHFFTRELATEFRLGNLAKSTVSLESTRKDAVTTSLRRASFLYSHRRIRLRLRRKLGKCLLVSDR